MPHPKRRRLCAATAALALTIIASPAVVSAAPAAPGASVQLLAWPNTTYLAKLKQGEPVPTMSITATTNLATLPAMYHGAGGKVSVEEDTIPNSGSAGYSQKGVETAAPTLQAAGFARPANTVDAAACRPGACVVCSGYAAVRAYTNNQEVFDNLYTWYNAPAKLTETTSSSHSMGIGFAITGESWTPESGSVTVTNETNASAARWFYDHEQVSNTVNYEHYQAHCSNDGHGISYYEHEARPTGFHSLEVELLDRNLGGGLTIGYTTCDYASSGTYTKTAGHNITFTAGIGLPFVNLSSTASYSSNTEVAFQVESPTDVCGSDDRGWAGADRAGSEPYVHCSDATTRGTSPLC